MKVRIAVVLAFVLSPLCSRLAAANDSFAEVAAGGIKFLKQADIVLQQEVLTIRESKVEVVYLFSNPTTKDVAITVAFPLPAYSFKPNSSASSPTYDFSVTTDGKTQKFKTITEATLDGKNVTSEVQRAGLPVADFRGWEGSEKDSPSLRLSAQARQRLVVRGLLDKDDAFPLWTASVTYVWEQRFPAGRVTEIKHAYTPQTGRNLFGPEDGDRGWSAARFPAGCSPSLETLKKSVKPGGEGGMIYQTWIAYILTTANNWKTPIGEFTLVIPKARDATVVLCSDLPAPRVSADKVTVSLRDYVPSRDLVVYFLAAHGPQAASDGLGRAPAGDVRPVVVAR